MKRRMLALLLAVTMVLGLAASVSAAGVVASGHDWRVDWVLTDDGTLTISGDTYMRDDKSELDSPWRKYMDVVKTIVIEEGVYGVERFAFTDFENVEEISLPESLETIGMSAFAGCDSLKRVDIPAAVHKINDMAFASCASLTMIDVMQENENFCDVDGVLMDKSRTTLIQVPAGLAGAYAVPDFVGTIQKSAFMGCDRLTSVSFPDHLTELPEAVLYGLDNLTTAKLPASLAEIPQAAFYGCAKLASIVIPEGLTAIGFDAFYGCTALTTVVVPASVKSINTQAFSNCSALTNVVFRGNAPMIDSESGIFYEDTLTAWYPAGDESWTAEIMQDYYGNATWKSYEVLPFADTLPFQFWYESTAWAVEKGITNGISATEFGPNGACNRAQVVTFLWRAAGSPEPAVTEHPFVDVPAGSFYEKAVLWAVEKNITTGTDATHFSPDLECNRATVVTFLHRSMDKPASQAAVAFTDVQPGQFYTEAVAWAVEKGVTNGMGDGTFGVDAACNRAQVVTFLYRAMA